MTYSVLIVDDSLTVRMDLGSCFQSAGFEVHLSSSLEQARETLREIPIDGLVLDVILPDGYGTEFLEELPVLTKSVPPVLMLSSESEVKSRIRGLQAGADEYVGKPYDRNYVVVRLGELIRARRQTHREDCVLLIDDSRTVREEVGTLLSDAGYRVMTASSGEEGLQLVALHRPCLVIVDSDLPGMDGAGVIRRLRLDTVLRGIPCLMLTGSETEETETRILDAGADAFLRKEEVAPLILARVAALLRSAGKPLESQSKTLGPSRILAVDDNSTFLNSLMEALVGEGFDLVRATSGEEAVEILGVQDVDCILLDLVMPGMSGEETCRRIKSARATRDIPLILLTALQGQESVLRGLAAGADDYIVKSTEFEVLKARIRSHLRRKQFQDEKRRQHAELLERELESVETKATKELATARAELIRELEAKNRELEQAYQELQTAQTHLVHSAKMASLGQLVAGLAHEINNPIAYASGNLEAVKNWVKQLSPLIQETLQSDALARWNRIEKRVDSASQGVERVADLVRKLRTFSRLDEGEFKSVEIPESIESALFFLEHRLNERIEIKRDYRGEITRLDCYASALNQVFMNLLVNAIDSIESNGSFGTISIVTDCDDEWFRIRIADSGPGLPPGSEERLFEPFFTTKPVGQGTGLGLSISFGIMQGHHGNISAHNLHQGGCEFALEIPRDLDERLKGSSFTPAQQLLGRQEKVQKLSPQTLETGGTSEVPQEA